MNKEPLLSVVVPVYNTEKYLCKCLDSIINQTYKNLEIVLVDDGSTDGSEVICDRYKEKDSRIVLIHQENGGESHARNIGLINSTGDVIAFVDCDDWLELDMYETMIHEMTTNNLDIIAVSWCKQFDGYHIDAKNNYDVSSDIFNREKFLEYIYRRDDFQGFAFMWDKLYSRKCLTNKNGNLLLFNENLKLGGDVLYLAESALNATRVKYLDQNLYHYYQRNDSGMHAPTSKKMMDWIESYRIVIELLNKNSIPNNIVDYAKRFMAYHASNAVEIAIKENDKSAKMFFQNIMRIYESVYSNLNFKHPERVERYKKLLTV